MPTMNPEPPLSRRLAGHQIIELERLGACAVETTRVWITEAGERVRAARRVDLSSVPRIADPRLLLAPKQDQERTNDHEDECGRLLQKIWLDHIVPDPCSC